MGVALFVIALKQSTLRIVFLYLFSSLSFPLIAKLGLCNIKKFLEAASIAQVLQRVSLCSPLL